VRTLLVALAAGAALFCLGLEAGASLSGDPTCPSPPPAAHATGCTAKVPDTGRTVSIPCQP
jgi:hypothetical protein